MFNDQNLSASEIAYSSGSTVLSILYGHFRIRFGILPWRFNRGDYNLYSIVHELIVLLIDLNITLKHRLYP